ncbi:MAG: septum formation initiator family protein [Terriglobales bacterium]|jgi:cell division protein FtsB
MDLQLAKERPGRQPRIRILPRGEEGLRAAIDQAMGQAIGHVKDQAKDQAPRAEAAAARWVERTRPVWSWLVLEWRRLGTAAAILLIVAVLLHAMFGANGMVVYRQKHAELQSLQSEVERLQVENAQYVEQIKSLKSDPAAIEKEAREQLHYTRRGEVVYVAPDPPQKPPTGRARNEH